MLKKVYITTGLIIFAAVAAIQIYKPFQPGKTNPGNALAETGRYLFFDTRLSYNNTKSCGSCHDPSFAFTDGYRRSVTAGGDNVKHNAPSLINIVLHQYFDWANPGVTTLEKQHERPLFNRHPPELGAAGNELMIIDKLKEDTMYSRLFAKAFPGEKAPIDFPHIIRSIAAFVGTLRSTASPYDAFLEGDSGAMSASARAGMQLFFSDRLKCGSCHPPPFFTMATKTRRTDSIYLNIGLYNVKDKNSYPENDRGLEEVTGNASDDGKFKIPSLRNVSLTAPYMHDGSVNNLKEIIDMYARGGRKVSAGPYTGDGKLNSNKDKRIGGFIISKTEKKELIDFLFSLTDSSIIRNPAFQNPFNLPYK